MSVADEGIDATESRRQDIGAVDVLRVYVPVVVLGGLLVGVVRFFRLPD